MSNVESKLDQLTKAVLNKNEMYKTEHPNEEIKDSTPAPPKEEAKPVEYPVYKFPKEEE